VHVPVTWGAFSTCMFRSLWDKRTCMFRSLRASVHICSYSLSEIRKTFQLMVARFLWISPQGGAGKTRFPAARSSAGHGGMEGLLMLWREGLGLSRPKTPGLPNRRSKEALWRKGFLKTRLTRLQPAKT